MLEDTTYERPMLLFVENIRPIPEAADDPIMVAVKAERVELHGLVRRPELNGKIGWRVGWVEAVGRYKAPRRDRAEITSRSHRDHIEIARAGRA